MRPTEEQHAAFTEASRALAESLGQSPVLGGSADVWMPRELEGAVLEAARVPSRSNPGHYYHLARTPSGWQHVNADCMGWLIWGRCAHIKEMNDMTESTALVPSYNVLALIDSLEDDEIVKAIGGQVTKSWVYEFPQGGSTVRGLSAVGVEQAAGHLAAKGEAIREIDVRIEYEDENEARFVARAGRFAIAPDGREALLDTSIRGKRQPKWIKLRNGGRAEDEHWYEKGITKAVRNAKLALLPESAVTYVLAEAVKAGRVKQVGNSPAPARQSAPTPQDAAPPNEEDGSALLDWLNKLGDERGAPSMAATKAWILARFNIRSLADLQPDDEREAITEIQSRINAEQVGLPV